MCVNSDETVEQRLQRYADEAPEARRRGNVAMLAREAGLSPSTVSRVLSGKYTGNCSEIARRLAEILDDREAATAIASGRFQLSWLVNTPKGLRIVKKQATVDEIREHFPEAYMVQIWRGKEPGEIHFVREDRRSREGGNPE